MKRARKKKSDPFRGPWISRDEGRRRAHAKQRRHLIRLLGWAPEPETREGRYAATHGELLRWAREKFGRRGYSPEDVAAAERRERRYLIGT